MLQFTQPDGPGAMRGMNRTGSTNSTGRPRFNPGGPGGFGSMGGIMGSNTTQAPILLGIGGGFLFVSVGLLAARLWSRRKSKSRLSLDDWTVVGATVIAIANYGLLSAAVLYGLGRRAFFVSFAHRRTALELLFVSQVLWYWSITLVKLSVAFLLLRLKHTRRWKIFLYGIIILILVAAVIQTCFQFLQCRPFSVYWDPRVSQQGPVTCFDRRVINGNIVAFSSIQVGLDIIFSFIPITFIRKLHRPRREKIFMCVLMALGIFASVAAIVRTMTLQNFYTSTDLFRTNVTLALWAVIEQQVALIAATIPTLKSFMEQTLVKLGLFFYDEGTETQVRGRLVHLGLLGEDDILEKSESLDDKSGASFGTLGSLREGRKRKEKNFDDLGSMLETINDKDVEDMLNQTVKRPV